MSGFEAAWAAYLCALEGHVRNGVGSSTNPDYIVWGDCCQRCGLIVDIRDRRTNNLSSGDE